MRSPNHDQASAQSEEVREIDIPIMLALLAIADYLEQSTNLLNDISSKIDILVDEVNELKD